MHFLVVQVDAFVQLFLVLVLVLVLVPVVVVVVLLMLLLVRMRLQKLQMCRVLYWIVCVSLCPCL